MARPLRLATRGSPLALRQVELVQQRFKELHRSIDSEVLVVSTIGDDRRDVPIGEIAGRGVFTNEVDQAVADGRADIAVHSAKDLPASTEQPGLRLAAVPERADVRDVLVGRRLDEIQPGGVIATGAWRRRVQLANLRPDLNFTQLRGNIGTRLERVPDGGAIVMALAALQRLALESKVAEVLSVTTMLPQVGQGAVALRCREDDAEVIDLLSSIDDTVAHRAVDAERGFLAELGGGCDAPVGAYATVAEDGHISMQAMIASLDGHVVLRRRHEGADPATVGRELARAMMELDGADALLAPR